MLNWSLFRLVAYELRTPTEAILGILEMLKKISRKVGRMSSYIGKEMLDGCTKLIQDIVHPTKIENKFVFKKEKINLVDDITNLIKGSH